MDKLELSSALHVAIAALVGLAVGIEREWSGHASGPLARFAGVRTFFLLGVIGGGAGLLCRVGYAIPGAVLLGGAALLTVTAYAMAVRRPESDVDGTTEAAAVVVLTLGALAGLGQTALAGGAVAVVVLVLGEKERMHWLVRHIGEHEMRAALQFAVLALVVLPLVPSGPYGPLGGIRPRALWGIVLLLSGLNFVGYLARRAIGPKRGYGITGMLGGLVSSKVVALQFARRSRGEPELAASLALGVVAAATVMFPRIAVIGTVLNPSVALALVPYLLPPFILGTIVIGLALRRRTPEAPSSGPPVLETRSPLRLWSAIQMAVLFQIALLAVAYVQSRWGSPGVLASAIALGITDIDALTVSMSRMSEGPDGVRLAARGICLGILASLVFKIALTAVIGESKFRRLAAAGLGLLLAAGTVSFLLVGRSP